MLRFSEKAIGYAMAGAPAALFLGLAVHSGIEGAQALGQGYHAAQQTAHLQQVQGPRIHELEQQLTENPLSFNPEAVDEVSNYYNEYSRLQAEASTHWDEAGRYGTHLAIFLGCITVVGGSTVIAIRAHKKGREQSS